MTTPTAGGREYEQILRPHAVDVDLGNTANRGCPEEPTPLPARSLQFTGCASGNFQRPEAENAVQLMLKHVTETPVPPSVRVGRPLPEGLDAVVLACLAKEPQDRPQGALELWRMLTDTDGARWSPDQAVEWWRNSGV